MWLLTLLSLLIILSLATAAKNNPVQVNFPEIPPASAQHNIVSDNFLGISWELSSFDTLWGKTPNEIPNAMQNYLSNIRARMVSPLRIRIGGNGMDGSTYIPAQKDMINFTDPNAYFNDIPVNFGPTFFDVLNAMSDNVGDMKFMIGLSMRDPIHGVDNVLELAAAAEGLLGNRLEALLFGNEPDLYAGHGERDQYNLTNYLSEVAQVVDVFRRNFNGTLLSTNILAGPTTCCNKWPLQDVTSGADGHQGLGAYPYKYYTVQHYPKHICNGANADNTNLTYFLDHSALRSFVQFEQTGVNLAKANGLPVLLTEYNSVSCGGSNISDTFTMSLWTTDAALKFASNNYSGIFLHTREHNVTYNLFDPATPENSTMNGWKTGSPYYTELVIAETLSNTGSVVVDLNLENSDMLSGVNTTGYGIWDNGGKTRGKLVLINRDEGDEHIFVIPSNITDVIMVRYLVAPSLLERRNISWAGQTVGSNGDLEGDQYTEFLSCGKGCNVTVPGPGLALVLLKLTSPDDFYQGNSTIAGLYGSGGQEDSGAVRLSWQKPVLMISIVFGMVNWFALC